MKALPSLVLLLALVPAQSLRAQDAVDSLARLGTEHHRHYRFDEALDRFDEAADLILDKADSLRTAADTLALREIEALSLLTHNALAMTEFVDQPEVFERRRLARDDFFRYYPFPDSSWIRKPNRIDSTATSPLAPATLRPAGAETVYFSAPDTTGYHTLFQAERRADGRFSAPERVDAFLPEDADCILPVLSPDGNRLYFSSNGLYGVGGYDLYSVRWNPRRRGWEAPVNMGFPYSSPDDDFLFSPTADATEAFFASTRGCPADSIDVYIVSFNAVPVYTPMTDPEELEALARMDLPVVEETVEEDPFAGRDHAELYMRRMGEVRAKRDTLAAHIKATDLLRSEYAAAPDSLRGPLQEQILASETRQIALRDEITRLTQEVRAIEAIFLEDGLVLNPDKVLDEETKPVRKPYEWRARPLGEEHLFTRRERFLIGQSGTPMYVTVLPEDSLILRRPSIDFTAEELASPLLDTLIRKMRATLVHPSQDGVGLAAPQVGLNRRLVLVQRFDKPGEPIEAYANIRIDTLSGPIVHGAEGCLSVPGLRGMVERHQTATVSYVDPETLETRTETVSGYTAVIFQHECDHLDGILYIDRTQIVAESPEWIEERKQFDYSRPSWW